MNFELVCSGGGSYNPEIMSLFQELGYNIKTISDYGIDSSIKEALLIAVLGVCCLKKIPANMPSVTGSDSLTILGEIFYG